MPIGVYPHRSRPVQERFWEKVKILSFSNESACWEWSASTSKLGYGYFVFRGRCRLASRVAYELVYGTFPKHLKVCHHCDNPRCVRPQHLFLGTQQDNLADMKTKGRHAFGGRIGNAKLTEDAVLSIIHSTEPTQVLAARYGVSRDHISRLKRGARWGHLNMMVIEKSA